MKTVTTSQLKSVICNSRRSLRRLRRRTLIYVIVISSSWIWQWYFLKTQF